MLILNKFEKTIPIEEGKNALMRATAFWDTFLAEVQRETGIPVAEIPGMLARLNRTGLYQTFIGTFLGYSGDIGYLTPNFGKFLDALKVTGSEIN